jgi:hypothetical protein
MDNEMMCDWYVERSANLDKVDIPLSVLLTGVGKAYTPAVISKDLCVQNPRING